MGVCQATAGPAIQWLANQARGNPIDLAVDRAIPLEVYLHGCYARVMGLHLRRSRADLPTAYAFVAAQFALLGLLAFWKQPARWTLPAWLHDAAVLLGVFGWVWLLLGAWSLGRSLTALPLPLETATLRTGGLYRLSRHPIYTGLLALAWSWAIAAAAPISLVLAAALTVVLAVKARYEEGALRAAYPDYPAYATRVTRFWPVGSLLTIPSMRISGERSIDIAAPPTSVSSLVADITRMGEWSPHIVQARWIAPATQPGVGCQFRGTNRLPVVHRWTSTATITDSAPGRTFAFAVGTDPTDPNTTWSYTFEPIDTGTRVTERWHMRREPPIVLRYYRLIGQRDRIASGVEETLRRIKAAAES
jgi:protein-S-isoprenylcysteine O-methyltransferase Ste14